MAQDVHLEPNGGVRDDDRHEPEKGNSMKIRREDALAYHAPSSSGAPAGKVSVVPTKPCRTQRDLSLAYTPGVAIPCLEIEKDPSLA